MVYHPSVYDRALPVDSYWETTDDSIDQLCLPVNQSQTCDVAIIGAGFTGLSAALHLTRYGIEARVLEAGMPGWGASGRNGGFCCMGATRLSCQALIQKFGKTETQRYYQEQRSAIDLVRQLAIEEGIDIDAQGTGEIQVAHHPSRWSELEAKQQMLTQIAQYPCQLWSQRELAEHGFESPEAYGALFVGVGFGLNPIRYVRGLTRAVIRQGAAIHGKSAIGSWEKSGNWHLLHTPGGTVRAKTVVIATNGYTQDTLHPRVAGCLLPALSQIITTRPLTTLELVAQGWCTETPVYDTRHLLFYYRLLPDRRFLLGSRGGLSGSPMERDRHRQWMVQRLGELFPAWRNVGITHSWNGLVCLSAAATPHVGWLDQDSSVCCALAYHGNGVAAGTWSGRAVAQLVAGKAQLEDLCAVFRQPLQRFPLPFLRKSYLQSAQFAYGIHDRLPF